MAVGLASGVADSILDAIFNATAYSVTNVYIKLHTGDPGAAGTSNAASETTRKAVSCSASSGGAITSDADISWTSISGSQDATHFSLWTDAAAGTFILSGTITANAYIAGDTYTIPTGDFDASFSIAS